MKITHPTIINKLFNLPAQTLNASIDALHNFDGMQLPEEQKKELLKKPDAATSDTLLAKQLLTYINAIAWTI